MEFLFSLLQNVVGGVLTHVALNIRGFLTRKIKETTQGMKPEELRRLLDTLGATSPDSIRALVYQQLGKGKKISNDQMEDVASVLINLARGANMLNSQGTPRSIYVR